MIDFAPRPTGRQLKSDAANVRSRNRRARLKEAGYCINGEKHGPPTHGVRCERCHNTHKKTRSRSPKKAVPS